MKTHKLLVLDLDETLIHASSKKLNQAPDFHYQDLFVYKRPHLDDFLEECSKLFDIAIWSSAQDDYVQNVVALLKPKNIDFEFIWAQSECWLKIAKVYDKSTGMHFTEYQNIKPLEKITQIGYEMKDLLIIDDSAFKVSDNPQNYLIIPAFEGNQEDDCLLVLLDFLKGVIHQDDFGKIGSVDWLKDS